MKDESRAHGRRGMREAQAGRAAALLGALGPAPTPRGCQKPKSDLAA